jgi:hypothetical protein
MAIMQIQKLIVKIMETIMVWNMPGTGHYAAFCCLFGNSGLPHQAHPISSQAPLPGTMAWSWKVP